MTINHWNDRETGGDDSWNLVRLGPAFLYVAKVTVKLPSQLDVQKPTGAKGATIKDQGDPPAEITIELQLTSRPELDAFEAARPLLRQKAKNGARAPLEIEHPNPNYWGITAIVIKEIDSPQPDAVQGWKITIQALEWKPAPNAVAPAPAKPKAVGDDAAAWAPYVDKTATTDSPAKTGAAANNLGL